MYKCYICGNTSKELEECCGEEMELMCEGCGEVQSMCTCNDDEDEY